VKKVLAVAGLASLLPVAALLLASPVEAGTTGYEQVTATALVAGVRTEGSVGASGGLVTLDGGSAQVSLSLDGDSATVRSAPYEPGGLVRTVVGQANTSAGEQVLDVPDAEATYPGTPRSSSVETVPGTSAGPVAVVGGTASANAGPGTARGTAEGSSFAVVGALTVGASTSEVTATVDQDAGRATQSARSSVGSVDVAGVLHLSDVVATGKVTADGQTHTAAQALTIGGADVGGQAVAIGNDGVTAVGTPLLPGDTLADATEQANAVLAAAGISVRTVGGHAVHDQRSAVADTGGVLITLTQDVAGLGANTLTVVLGGLALTETDSPALVSVVDPCAALGGCSGAVGTPGAPATTTTTFLPGTPGLPGAGGVASPQVLSDQPVAYVLAGRRFTARTALLGFATWQLLSLGLPTLYALVERRRRLKATVA
jgi:hypothetical protein